MMPRQYRQSTARLLPRWVRSVGEVVVGMVIAVLFIGAVALVASVLFDATREALRLL